MLFVHNVTGRTVEAVGGTHRFALLAGSPDWSPRGIVPAPQDDLEDVDDDDSAED